METIALSITRSKKVKFHEVADLMLEIYNTLVRMRYLDPSWIHKGPHNIDHLLPKYRSLGVHNSVIYLYSILPYVDTGGAGEIDYFEGEREFADFRREKDVERGRDPFYNEEEILPSHITPLPLLGNHDSVILYNCRTHCVSIIDGESGQSSDHNLYDGGIFINHESEDEDEDDEDDDEGYEEDEDDDEGHDEDEDEDEDDDEGYNEGYDEDEDERYDSRPAGPVLRDIIQWYHDLTESPGAGWHCTRRWDPDTVKPLFRKHGWPHAHFDGHAFLVDMARAKAYDSAKFGIEKPIGKLHQIEASSDYENSPHARQQREKIAAAKTVDEEWAVRYRLWQSEQYCRPDLEELRKVKEARDNINYEELPLLEVKETYDNLRYFMEGKLEALRQEARASDNAPGVEARLRYAEEKMRILRDANEASRADAKRLFPGRVAPSQEVERLEGKRDDMAREVEEWRGKIKALHDWRSQVPTGASEVRNMVQRDIDSLENTIETCLEKDRIVAKALEECKLQEGIS